MSRLGRLRPSLLTAAATLLFGTAPGGPAAAQALPDGWDGAEVMQLVQRAIERRALPLADTTLQRYTARADGTVQFLLEAEGHETPLPLRLDQVSVDLYWQAPDRTRQAIRALRKQDLLPIRQFRYYADRLTVVQEGFGDIISVGEGNDVRAVPHPLSRMGPGEYSFRAADTVTLRVPGLAAPIQVVRIEVRPRQPGQPRFVGDVYVDAVAATLVRMRFSFTPAAYVDPRNERIEILLEHGLWEGRYWLPYTQELEVRRQAPEIDLGVTTVIRARLAVRDYDFEAPVRFPEGVPAVTYPAGEGDTTRFEVPLRQAILDEGLRVVPLDAALEMAGGASALLLRRPRVLPPGLPRLRLHTPSLSASLRANRIEGGAIGAGIIARPTDALLFTLHGSVATGPGHVRSAATMSHAVGRAGAVHAFARMNDVQEIEPAPPASQAINSIGVLAAGRDWIQGYLADAVGAELQLERGRLSISVGADLERHRSASAVWRNSPLTGRDLPPVLPVDEGTRARASLRTAWSSPRLSATALLGGGSWEGDAFMTATAALALRQPLPDGLTTGVLRLHAGLAAGAIPPQHLFLPAGTRTLPGHRPTALAGSRYIGGSAEVQRLLPGLPFAVHLGAHGAAVGGTTSVPQAWGIPPEARARAAGSVGLGIFDGLVRIDFAHGLRGTGEWRAVVSPVLARRL